MITQDMSMSGTVLQYPQLLPLFGRFKIRLGFGEQSIREVCENHGIIPGFFLEIVNAYLDEEYQAMDEFSHMGLKAMVSYLNSTHEYYLQTALPRVERKIKRMLSGKGFTEKEKQLVADFFEDYKSEFLEHLSREDQVILPYILELERQSGKTIPDKEFIRQLEENPIRDFAKEHERLETSLENLSRLIISYLPPRDEQEVRIQILKELAELVKDLVDHAEMEDRVLIPRVVELEEQLLQRNGQK